jgi:hypothetical protein
LATTVTFIADTAGTGVSEAVKGSSGIVLQRVDAVVWWDDVSWQSKAAASLNARVATAAAAAAVSA